jgi:hypothetical protein
MPYIKQHLRTDLESREACPTNSGELNFMFTAVIKDYMGYKGLSYKTCNDIIGALEGAKLEFYRRVAVPYEDKKIEENGAVYEKAGD